MGKDVFEFIINRNGRLEMPGVKKTRDELKEICNTNSSEASIYGSCGALIQKDGWQISPDYPW